MIIAVYYVDLGNDVYSPLLENLVASARAHAPDAKLVHLTDATTPEISGFDKTVRTAERIPAERLMPYRVALTRRAVEGINAPILFLDPDTEILGPVPTLGEEVDAAFTRRRVEGLYSMPINTGVMMTRPTEGARRFWREVEAVALSFQTPELHRWYGDQMAIAATIGVATIYGADRTLAAAGASIGLMDEHPWLAHYKGRKSIKP